MYKALAMFGTMLVLLITISLPTQRAQQASAVVPAEITSATTSPEAKEEPQRERLLYPVVKVIDGDTIAVSISGQSKTIRLIGINAPESVDPRRPVQCFGEQASEELKRLLNGERVELISDPTQGTQDRFGRLLAYVYRDDGLFLNEHMIRDGYAYQYTYAAPYTFRETFIAAEASARLYKRGLWADGVCSPVEASVTQVTQKSRSDQCARNAYNCSDFKTQSEAQAVYDACGGAAYDIHELDSNNDGSACESLP
jgi:micrococcal nuclease